MRVVAQKWANTNASTSRLLDDDDDDYGDEIFQTYKQV